MKMEIEKDTIRIIEKDTIRITEYNLYDFCKAIEQGVMLGYRIGDSNEECPQHIGFEYHAVMTRPEIVDNIDHDKLDEIMANLDPSTQEIEFEAPIELEVDIPVKVIEQMKKPTGRKK